MSEQEPNLGSQKSEDPNWDELTEWPKGPVKSVPVYKPEEDGEDIKKAA